MVSAEQQRKASVADAVMPGESRAERYDFGGPITAWFTRRTSVHMMWLIVNVSRTVRC